jgi:hypothetical protein
MTWGALYVAMRRGTPRAVRSSSTARSAQAQKAVQQVSKMPVKGQVCAIGAVVCVSSTVSHSRTTSACKTETHIHGVSLFFFSRHAMDASPAPLTLPSFLTTSVNNIRYCNSAE